MYSCLSSLHVFAYHECPVPRETRRENWVLQIELRTTVCYNAGAEKQPVSFVRVTNAPNAGDISR